MNTRIKMDYYTRRTKALAEIEEKHESGKYDNDVIAQYIDKKYGFPEKFTISAIEKILKIQRKDAQVNSIDE